MDRRARIQPYSKHGHQGRTTPGARDGVHEPESGTGEGTAEPSDEGLARRVQRGDRDALELLVSRYLRPIHAVIASYLAEPADVEDAVQDTFLRALDRIASYQPVRPFAPWLYQVARNVARDRISAMRRRRTESLPDEGMAEPAADPAVTTERAEVRRLVDLAIDGLPEQRRTAFRLHDVEGYTTDEVARLMGLSPGTIRSHVHHARRALRAALATRFGDPANAEG
jgi:RNA polymerase sigma-70 factor (ECF subfamily)